MIRRPPRSTLDRSSAASDVYKRQRPNRALFDRTLKAIKDAVKAHQYPLSGKDLDRITHILDVFYQGGPQMDYRFASATPTQNVPSFVRLMTASDHTGPNWNFLATRAAYDRVRDMQQRNVIVPLVGDFAGRKTLRAIASYLKAHGAVVSVFYISNVEYYIQPDSAKWASWQQNLGSLPVDDNSTFIRWVSSTGISSLEPLKPH